MDKVNILVVEDEAITAMDITNRLQELNYQIVSTAFSGEDAIEKVKKFHPDLVIMDIILQGKIDGTKAAKIISQQFDIPIIYLTAYSDDNTFKRAIESGPYGYITKPFETRNLHLTIELALNKRMMEKKLAVAERRYQLLMENASCGFLIHNAAGTIVDINKVGEKIFDLDKDNMINNNFIKYISKEEQEYAKVQLNKLQIEKKVGPNAVRIVRPTGEIRDIEFSTASIELDNNNLSLSIINDITDSKKIISQSLLDSKLASVGTLAVGIIHEVNNPLNWVLSNLSIMKDKINNPSFSVLQSKTLIEEMKDLIDESIQGSQIIADIVRYLKGFSHSDAEKLANIDIHEAIRSAIKIASPHSCQRATVITDFFPHLPLIAMLNNSIQQVFLNLIINSVQAFPADRKKELNIINITTLIEDAKIKIEFSDNGVGIPEANLAKIFEPFFTTKPVGVGTGLGLSICYNIIHKLGGKIEVQSEINEGTVFSIYLPLQIKVNEVNAIEKTDLDSRLKILIVDDEPFLLKLLNRLLSDKHEITQALGGREALSILGKRGNEFDLIITDLNMPDVNGMDLYRFVIHKLYHLKNKIIFISGGGLMFGKEESPLSINNICLNKPFTRQKLLQAITKMVKQYAYPAE